MSEFKVKARPEGAPKQSRQKLSRHRAEPAAPATHWGRITAGIPSFGRRAAVVTTACAVLIGVGAASQAAEQSAPRASSAAATATASPAPTLNFDKTLIAALPAPTAAALAPQSVAKRRRPRPLRRPPPQRQPRCRPRLLLPRPPRLPWLPSPRPPSP
ncbi:hypothetical protein [Arthrobacter sp. KBS0703]|uniref:hypothetical protein n=1 Tax=Arthrobacter sp. KBS0703 TaxID=1955698 RepID=UPI0021B11073|nr:hypothetical protein [Arthrobacter sp. KBS0703]